MQQYRIINLQSQKGKQLNGQVCQLIKSEFTDLRLNVRLTNPTDPTIYRLKLENLQSLHKIQVKQAKHSNKEEQMKLVEFLMRNKHETTDIDDRLIKEWMRQTHVKKLYIGQSTIALLSKNDFDREQTHKEPWMVDYIYTIPKARRKGHALELLKQVKREKQSTGLCSSKGSTMLFEKAGFKKGVIQPAPGQLTVMRFP